MAINASCGCCWNTTSALSSSCPLRLSLSCWLVYCLSAFCFLYANRYKSYLTKFNIWKHLFLLRLADKLFQPITSSYYAFDDGTTTHPYCLLLCNIIIVLHLKPEYGRNSCSAIDLPFTQSLPIDLERKEWRRKSSIFSLINPTYSLRQRRL